MFSLAVTPPKGTGDELIIILQLPRVESVKTEEVLGAIAYSTLAIEYFRFLVLPLLCLLNSAYCYSILFLQQSFSQLITYSTLVSRVLSYFSHHTLLSN